MKKIEIVFLSPPAPSLQRHGTAKALQMHCTALYGNGQHCTAKWLALPLQMHREAATYPLTRCSPDDLLLPLYFIILCLWQNLNNMNRYRAGIPLKDSWAEKRRPLILVNSLQSQIKGFSTNTWCNMHWLMASRFALKQSLRPRGMYFPIHPSSRQCKDRFLDIYLY